MNLKIKKSFIEIIFEVNQKWFLIELMIFRKQCLRIKWMWQCETWTSMCFLSHVNVNLIWWYDESKNFLKHQILQNRWFFHESQVSFAQMLLNLRISFINIIDCKFFVFCFFVFRSKMNSSLNFSSLISHRRWNQNLSFSFEITILFCQSETRFQIHE